MATKKTAKTKRAGSKGTQKRTAGKTARARAPRVTAKSMAADIVRRDNRRAGFWDEVQAEVKNLWRTEGAATVMPRESTPATH